MSQSPTFNQIKAQVAAIRRRVPGVRTVAIRTSERWTGQPLLQDGEETYSIHQCDSPLAMRIALRDGNSNNTQVLITNLDEEQISDDIRLRLKPRRLVQFDSWQIVKTLFQARTIDPRITRHRWIAETLINLPPDAFTPVSSGFLDAETVWPILLDRLVGLPTESPDLLSLLKWSTQTDHVARFRAQTSEFRTAAAEWLTGLAGPPAATILDCVARHEAADALPIGLAVGVVFHPQVAGRLDRAVGRLEERYLGGQAPTAAIAEAWTAAATDVVRLGLSDSHRRQQLLNRADEILREVEAESFAWLSDTSPLGFQLRLAELGKRIDEALSSPQVTATDSLQRAQDAVQAHDKSSRERRRMERVEMAMRLVRWMSQQDPHEPQSLSEAAHSHLHQGGFVDWARLTLRSGDPVRELSTAYARLFDKVTAITEQRSRQFAALLCDWTAAGTSHTSALPVEHILDQIVAPLASESPVLVIVIDGMSVAVFRELMDDLLGQEYLLLAEQDRGLRPGLATIPSVTEASRTSLLCGRLLQGNANTEKTGFAAHPALLAQCRNGFPPVLFHKASLQETEDASLAADIRKEIGSAHRRIVGVVINAVDDHLAKGEQIDTRWTRDGIKVLPALLHEAKAARRTVILLSDHGHVIDCNAAGSQHEGGERWRFDEGTPEQTELRINGPRVVIPESHSLIAPWTEKLRYGVKKNGYHGGITPQEMVVPIGVLTAVDDVPEGWTEAPVDTPIWWDAPDDAAETPRPQSLPPLKPEPRKPKETLFDLDDEAPEQSPPAATAAPAAAWVRALFNSPVFADQKQLGGRAVPTDEVFERLLQAIDARGGKITSTALARAIGFAPMRLRGLLAVAQRVLNVDGYAVLTRDEASDTIEFDRTLLLKQFDLVDQ